MGVKKSNFTAKTAISDVSTLDFVESGQNFKILKPDFVNELGATGTIVQAGPVTAVPVLDVQGTVNNIRNMRGVSGIEVSINAENGIDLISTAGDTFSKQTFTASGTILESTSLVVSTGVNTLEMPTTHVGYLRIKSISGDITMNPGTNTIENGNTVLSTTSKNFNLDGTVWLEV